MFAQQAFLSPPSTIRYGYTAAAETTRRTTTIRAHTAVVDNTKKNKGANLYQVLLLEKSASPVKIKAAYRCLAKRFHPDTNKSGAGDSGDFIEIHNAYITLSDPIAKARYDLSISLSLSIGFRCGDGDRFLHRQTQTRRWETDQCW